jgi:hypothetical protein
MQNEPINYLPYVLKFDGQDDHIVLPEMNINYSQGLTIEAWVYYNSFKHWSRVIDLGNGAGKDNIVFANVGNTNSLALDIKKGAAGERITAENALETGKWMHLAATIDAAGNGKLYKNGEEIQSGKIQLPPQVSLTLNYISKSNWESDGYFNGRMAEVRLWNRARLAEELQKDIHRRLAGNEVGLVGYWSLNEGYGDIASDDGKIQGASWHQEIFFPVTNPLSYPQPVLSFHGQPDYVEIKDPFEKDTEFTISLWVKPSVINDGAWHGIIGKQGDQYRKPGLWLCPNNSGLYYHSFDWAGKSYGEQLNNFFEAKNQWIHITWVKQETEYRFYRNGELFATKPAPERFYTNKHSSYWIGKIDLPLGDIAEFSIWSRARNQAEIKADMYRYLAGNETGLVGYWPLNEGSGNTTADRTNRGNNGKVIGATWGEKTAIKSPDIIREMPWVLNFDGQVDYISLAEMNIDYAKGFTIEAWVYYNSLKMWSRIIDFGSGENKDNIILANAGGTNTLMLDIRQGSVAQRIVAEKVLEIGKWMHLVATIDTAGNGKLYKNGQEVVSGKIQLPPNVNRTLNYIGKSNWTKDSYFDGQMAEIRLWNRTRSPEELRRDMQWRIANSELGLVGYWPLNEGYGDIANDKTTSNNCGKMTGTTWVENTNISAPEKMMPLPSFLTFQHSDTYIEVKDPFENDREFTISLWVKPSILKDGSSRGLIGHQGDKYRKPGLWLTPDTSGLHYSSFDPNGNHFLGWIDNFFETTEEWVHVTWVKKGTEYRFYRNGKLLTTQPAPEQFFCNKNTLYWIGRVENFWSGKIAEVSIWNYPRSEAEIKGDMYARLVGNELGLVAYWPLNDGTGTQAKDLTIRANHGKIYFATWQQQHFIKPVLASAEQNFIKSALKFDGADDHIVLPRMNIDYAKGFTIEAWVYYNNFNKSSRIIDFANGIDIDNIIFANAATTNALVLDIKQGATGEKITADRVLEIGKWMHLAATINASGNAKIYKNGEEMQSGKIQLPQNINRTLNYIARSHYTLDGYFDGWMSEVRLWNKARSAAELKKDINRRLLGNEAGLVGYWPLNEGSGYQVLDKTSNANAGKINGATWWQNSQSPYLHPVLNFDGKGDYVEVPEHNNSSNSLTVSAWARSHTPTWNQYGCLVSKRNPYSLHPEAGGKTIHFYIRSGGWKFVSVTPNIDITQWHHYAGTFDGTTLRLYIDGEEVAAKDLPGKLDNDNGRLYIGRDIDGMSRYFNGQIAEVQVWDKALIQAELQNIMHRSLMGNESGLIGYWPLNEGSGDTVLDRTKRSLHGKIVGATWDGQVFFANEPVIYKHGWQQVQKLQPTELKTDSFFGEEVAISGEWAIAGARKADMPRVQDAGSAYILNLQNKMWHIQQKLQPMDSRVGDQFGSAVAINCEWAIVGARKADTLGIKDPGAAYAFRLQNGVWVQKQKLQPEDLGAYNYFGNKVVISGEWAMIGASHARARGLQNVGAVYVFRLENGVWQEKQKLQPLDLGAKQCFGHAIAISGEWAIIGGGDRKASAGVKRPGGAYLYRLENGVWQEKQKLQSPQQNTNDLFGYSVAICGEQAFVGAVNTPVAGIFSAGAVYVYQWEKGVWQPQQRLVPDNPQYCGFFGATIAIAKQKQFAIIGSTRADSPRLRDTGGAYIFQLKKGEWQTTQKLQPNDLHYESYFGFSTPIDGEWIFVTAAWANAPKFKRVGSIYVFECQ